MPGIILRRGGIDSGRKVSLRGFDAGNPRYHYTDCWYPFADRWYSDLGIFRHIDEAKIKQAETVKLIELKKMEMAERARQSEEKAKSLKIKISIALGLIMFGAFAIGYAIDKVFAGAVIWAVCAIVLILMWIK